MKSRKLSKLKIWDRKSKLFGKNAYGALILCGKGVLGNDVRAMLDIMIEPGIRFAPFQGLSPEQVFTALTDNGQTKKGDSKQNESFWEAGGHKLLKNSLLILKAMVDAQNENRRVMALDYSYTESDIVELEIAKELAKRDGLDTSSYDAEIEDLKARLDEKAQDMTAPRKVFWTPYSLDKVRKYITSFIHVGGEGTPNRPNSGMIQIAQGLGVCFIVDEETQNFTTQIDFTRVEDFAHPEVKREGSPLNAALAFAINEYPNFKDNFTSSYEQTFNRLINPLLEGEKLCDWDGVDEEGNPILGTPWHMMEEGVDVSQVAYGKFLSFNLPEVIYGDAGVLIQNLVKNQIFNIVKTRKSDWAESDHRPIFLFIDECQEIVGEEDQKLAPMSRSLGLYFICATQQYESVYEVMGNEKSTTLFLNTFQSLISFRTSDDTYQYLSKRLGTAMLTVFEEKSVAIDYRAATMRVADSILNDDEHPDAAALSKIDRLGGGNLAAAKYEGPTMGWEGSKSKRIGGRSLMEGMEVPCGGMRKVQPIIKPEELTTYLNVRGNAICHIQRAGSKMIDFAKFDHIGVSDINKMFPKQQEGGNL